MSEIDDFLAAVLPRQRSGEQALVNGDAGPRRTFWSRREPITILGAGRNALNRHEVDDVFDSHVAASVAGEPQPDFQLRVTLIFRREDGEWRAIHRHADPRVPGQPAVERARELLKPSPAPSS